MALTVKPMLYLADLYFINDDGSYRLQWTNQALVDRVTHPGSVDDDNEYYQQLAKYQYLTDHLNDGSDRAVSYRVNIYNKNSGRCIYSTVVNDGTSLDVDLSPEEYLWEVEALNSSGGVITRSGKAYINTEYEYWNSQDAQISYKDSTTERQMSSLGDYWNYASSYIYCRLAAGGRISGENIEEATFIVCGPGNCGNEDAWKIPQREGYMYSVSNAFGGFDGEFQLSANCLITCGGIYEYENGQWNYKMFTAPWVYGSENGASNSSDYLLADEGNGNILYKWDSQQDKIVEVMKGSSEIYYFSDYYYVTKDGVFSIADNSRILQYNVEWGENPVFNDMFLNIMAKNSSGSPIDVLQKGQTGSIVAKYFFFEEDAIIEKEVVLFSGKAQMTYDAEEIFSARIGNCFCYVLQDEGDYIENPGATAIIHEISSDGSVKTHSFTCNTYEDITFSTNEYGNLQCSYYDCEEYDTVTRIYEDINLKFTPLFPDGDKIYAGDAKEITFEELDGCVFTVEYSLNKFVNTLNISTTSSKIDVFGLPTGKYDLRISADGGEWFNCKKIAAADTSTSPKLVASDENTQLDLFFANVDGVWEAGYAARHNGFKYIWNGTGEQVSIGGKNHIADIFRGWDENILILTDDENGDALFVDDIYTEFGSTDARLSNIYEIRAGNGDDVIDMTSAIYEYDGYHITIRGGNGNDTIWANGWGANIFGDAGNDRIIGTAGDDIIAGGAGDDRLHGGGGYDTFCFCDNWGKDTVTVTGNYSVQLWFNSGNIDNWDAENRIYRDGANTVRIQGDDYCDIELYFGDEYDDYYMMLQTQGAFDESTSRYIFEKLPPGQITNLSISRTQKDSSVILQWNASPENEGVTEYEIRIDDSNKVYRTEKNTFTIDNLSMGEHCFTVTAVDCTGNRSAVSEQYSFNIVKTTFTETVPTLPQVQVTGKTLNLTGVSADALENEEDRVFDLADSGKISYEEIESMLQNYLLRNNAYSEEITGTDRADKITFSKTYYVADGINLYSGDDQLILNAIANNVETDLNSYYSSPVLIDFGSGDDLLLMKKRSSMSVDCVDLGDGNDMVYLEEAEHTNIYDGLYFGDGDDTFYISKNIDGLTIPFIDFGEGNDIAIFQSIGNSDESIDIDTLAFGSGNDVLQISATTAPYGNGNTFFEIDMGDGIDTLELKGDLTAEYIYNLEQAVGSGTVAFMDADTTSLEALLAAGFELVNAGKGFTSKDQELADNSRSEANTITATQDNVNLWLAGRYSDAAQSQFGFTDECDWYKVNITRDVDWILINPGEGMTCNLYNQNGDLVNSYSSYDYNTNLFGSDLTSLGSFCYLEFTIDQYSCGSGNFYVQQG